MPDADFCRNREIWNDMQFPFALKRKSAFLAHCMAVSPPFFPLRARKSRSGDCRLLRIDGPDMALTFFLLLVAVPAAILIYYAEAQENNDAILVSFELFFALVFLYMLLSSHTVYREGWFKTLVKSLLVFGSFTFVALCIAFVLIIRLIYTYWE